MIQFSKYGYGQGKLPGRTIDDREIKNEKIFHQARNDRYMRQNKGL